MVLHLRARGLEEEDEHPLHSLAQHGPLYLFIWQRKHRCIGRVLRSDGLLHEIIEGRMGGKPTKGQRRIQMLYDSANNDGYVALE